ncbi:hypothetical protein JEQ12_007685 [Ovis aries]|uniref:Myeloid-associated differentiation marker-like n=1 Tax=Ovis aries TaxID=9940 RepID=A0A836CT59_SHEEP|nr:hypothetical protein JEQ12_007685 [Ovis aries]
MSMPTRLLTELTEQPEDESANVGKDRVGSPQPGSKVTPPVRVTCLTITIAMGTSSGLGSGALGFLLHLGQLLSACLPSLLHGHWSECAVDIPEEGALCVTCCCLRLPQLFSTCVASSLVTDMGVGKGAIVLPYGPYQDWAVAATAFSCLTSVLYATEVACTWNGYKITNTTCYVLTVPGLLKVLETFVAGVIFAFLGNTSLYLHQPALEWCVAVHSICFILAAVTALLNMGKWEHRPPVEAVIVILSVILYVSTLVLWPLYQFSEELGGQPQRPRDGDCRDDLTYDMCA